MFNSQTAKLPKYLYQCCLMTKYSTRIFLTVLYIFLFQAHSVLEWLGFRFSGLVTSLVIPLFLTMVTIFRTIFSLFFFTEVMKQLIYKDIDKLCPWR